MNTITLGVFLSVLVPALQAIAGTLDATTKAGKLVNLLLHIAQAFQGQVSVAPFSFHAAHTAPVSLSSLPEDMTPHAMLAWADSHPVPVVVGGSLPFDTAHAATDAPFA